jgi:hypothetical protein
MVLSGGLPLHVIKYSGAEITAVGGRLFSLGYTLADRKPETNFTVLSGD